MLSPLELACQFELPVCVQVGHRRSLRATPFCHRGALPKVATSRQHNVFFFTVQCDQRDCDPILTGTKVAGSFETILEREMHEAYMIRYCWSNVRTGILSMALSNQEHAYIGKACHILALSGFFT